MDPTLLSIHLRTSIIDWFIDSTDARRDSLSDWCLVSTIVKIDGFDTTWYVIKERWEKKLILLDEAGQEDLEEVRKQEWALLFHRKNTQFLRVESDWVYMLNRIFCSYNNLTAGLTV